MWINKAFPKALGGYRVISQPTGRYNCIAWAVGRDSEWWTYLPGYMWVGNRSPLVDSLIDLFTELGYVVCEDANLEEGFDKVAIYAKGLFWKHAARQLADGRWTSKLGSYEDIDHLTPEVLAGDFYGGVHCIMRKRHDAGDEAQSTE